jgi:hypothetical protein
MIIDVYVRKKDSTKWEIVSKASIKGNEAIFNPPVVLEPRDMMSFDGRAFENTSDETITIDKGEATPKGV